MKTSRSRAQRHNTKKFAAKVAKVATMVVKLVTSLGGFPKPGDREGEMILPTRAGVLTVHPVSTWCSVMTRFEEPARAGGRVSSNGKWNFHGFDDMEIADITAELSKAFGSVALPVDERETGREAARAWLVKAAREWAIRWAGIEGHSAGVTGSEATPVPASVDFELHAAYMHCYEREVAVRRAEQGPGLASTKPAAELAKATG